MRPNERYFGIVLALMVTVVLLPANWACAAVIDDFEDSTIDASIWLVRSEIDDGGNGWGTVTEEGGQLVLDSSDSQRPGGGICAVALRQQYLDIPIRFSFDLTLYDSELNQAYVQEFRFRIWDGVNEDHTGPRGLNVYTIQHDQQQQTNHITGDYYYYFDSATQEARLYDAKDNSLLEAVSYAGCGPYICFSAYTDTVSGSVRDIFKLNEIYVDGPQVNHYDRNDRLVGQEFPSGFSIGYEYDGNGNLTRRMRLGEDENADGMLDMLQFVNGIDLGSPRDYYIDSDGDGWTDFQELKAQSDFESSAELPWLSGQTGSVLEAMDPGTGQSASEFAFNFRPSRYVMAVGDLDGIAGEEIVFSADGDTGGNENFIYVLAQTLDGWTREAISVGDSVVTSLAIGDPGTGGKAIYAGLRNPVHYGSIMELALDNGSWVNHTLAASADKTAYVLGVRNGSDVLVSLKMQMELAGQTYRLTPAGATWDLTLFDGNPGLIDGAIITSTGLCVPSSTGATVRLLDDTVHIRNEPLQSLLDESAIAHYSFNGNAFDGSEGMRDGVVNGAILTQDRDGNPDSAYYFDSSDGSDNVTIINGGEISFDVTREDYSVAVWVYPEGPGSIIHDAVENPYDGFSYQLYIESTDNTLHAKAWNLVQEVDLTCVGGLPVTFGQWYHIALTVKERQMSLYLNGEVVARCEIAEYSTKNAGNLVIGSGFTGAIDDVTIFGRGLSATEVAFLSGAVNFELCIPDSLSAGNIVPNGEYFGFSTISTAGDTSQSTSNYHYVDDDYPAVLPPDDYEWASFNTDIQSAIIACNDGDVIIVNNGVYAPVTIDKEITVRSINGPDVTVVDGSNTNQCVISSRYLVIEGLKLAHGYLSVDANGEARGAGVCMSKGGELKRCIVEDCSISPASNYVLLLGGGVYLGDNGIISSCEITGCKINTNNHIQSATFDSAGGGVYLEKGGHISDSTISGCEIRGVVKNVGVDMEGGGIYAKQGGVIEHCTIENNSIIGSDQANGSIMNARGAGVYSPSGKMISCVVNNNTIDVQADYENSRLTGLAGGVHRGYAIDCDISNNRIESTGYDSDGDGGGVSQAVLVNCVLRSNSVSVVSNSRGAYAEGAAAYYSTLTNCVVVANSVYADGGWTATQKYSGYARGALSGCTVRNAIIYGNSAYAHGEQNAGATGGAYDADLYNSLVFGNSASAVAEAGYTTLWPDYDDKSTLADCYAANPLFVNYALNDFHLQEGSPCVNLGSNLYVTAETDKDGNERICDGVVDMGVYEYGALSYEPVEFAVPRAEVSSTHLLHFLRVRDIDESNDISYGDELVFSLFELGEHSWNEVCSEATSIENPDIAHGYSLCSYDSAEFSGTRTYVTGPDGRIYVKQYSGDIHSDASTTETLFCGQYAGQKWHALSHCRSSSSLVMLVGLLELSDSPETCKIIIWDSLDEVSNKSQGNVSGIQTEPRVEVSSAITSGGRSAQVCVVTYDNEGNSCLPVLQYRTSSSGEWVNATINAIDGQMWDGNAYLSSDPGGTSHSILWDTWQDVGSGFSGTVEIRIRGVDISMVGQWSAIMPYYIDTDQMTDVPSVHITSSPEFVGYLQETIVLSGTSNESTSHLWGQNLRNGRGFLVPVQPSWNTPAIPLEQGDNEIIIYGNNADGFTVSDAVAIHRGRYNVPEIAVDSYDNTVEGNATVFTGTSNANVVKIKFVNVTNNDEHVCEASASWISLPVQLDLGVNEIHVYAYNNCDEYTLYQLTVTAVGSTWYVSPQNTHLEPDGSRGNPYLTITEAINRTIRGDEICVAAGQYDENLVIAHDLVLKGGYDSDDWDLPRDVTGSTTIINGLTGSVLSVRNANACIDGFTITGGNTVTQGLGVCITSTSQARNNITISHCIIRDNAAITSQQGGLGEIAGAGVYCSGNVDLKLCDNEIRDNELISNYSGSFVTMGEIYGAGVYCSDTVICEVVNNLVVANHITVGNYTVPYGAGAYVPHGYIRNNTIANNSFTNFGSVGNGAGVCTVDAVIRNSIVWNNSPDQIAGHNCDRMYYSDIQGDVCEGTNGNITSDPLFFDPMSGDYHLKSMGGHWNPYYTGSTAAGGWVTDYESSPCIDTGDPNSPTYEETFAHGSRINMGAYGGTSEASRTYLVSTMVEDLDGNQFVDIGDLAILLSYWLQNEVPYDLSGDGVVDFKDYALIASNWRNQLYKLATTTKGRGTLLPEMGYYAPGTVVSLLAQDDVVRSWQGTDDDASTDVHNTVTMDTDKTVSLLFEYDVKMNDYSVEIAGDWTPLFATSNEPAEVDGSVGLTGYQYIRSEIDESADYQLDLKMHLYGEDGYEWGDPAWFVVSCGRAYGRIIGAFSSGRYATGTEYPMDLSVATMGTRRADVTATFYAAIKENGTIIAEIYPGKSQDSATVTGGHEYSVELYAEENDTQAICGDGDCGASYDMWYVFSLVEH